ncbi:MAG: COG2426 family protein [Oscillospiraceae bacterium]
MMLQKYLLVFLVSMVPMIELRGAVLLAPGLGLPMLPLPHLHFGEYATVPFIHLFARKVLTWGADKPVVGRFFQWCLVKGHRGGEKLKAKAGRGLFLALMLFVAIPIPGTGAWTGTLAASFLDMEFKPTVLAVLTGVAIAGIIMTLVGTGVFAVFSFQ